jgi:GNAT superfamily N-acetyltransferase
MTPDSTPTIRPLRPDTDIPRLFALIHELADYEKLPMHVDADGLAQGLSASPWVGTALAWDGESAVGYALWYPTFSTFRGRSRLFLEDLYVTPTARGKGFGKALLAHVAGVAVERGCEVLHWQVLAWNELAIRFYRGLGAELDDGWNDCRLTGEPLTKLAALK